MAYIEVCVNHEIKPKEIKETDFVRELVPDTVKAQSHDSLHTFLMHVKRQASKDGRLMDRQTDRQTDRRAHCERGSHPVWGEGVLGG